ESKGVTVFTSTRVSGIEAADGHALSIALDNGSQLPADLLISATGVKPNVSFLDGSRIESDLGIVVDQRLQTTVDFEGAALRQSLVGPRLTVAADTPGLQLGANHCGNQQDCPQNAYAPHRNSCQSSRTASAGVNPRRISRSKRKLRSIVSTGWSA
ncbi:MAG TPA: hypothetical protein EYQ31_14580, partial [Candidatus Handelsmanbacteria bacterium]|nr:hypothetical protein [Candidatus Handelsmanbacteria bacterium]